MYQSGTLRDTETASDLRKRLVRFNADSLHKGLVYRYIHKRNGHRSAAEPSS